MLRLSSIHRQNGGTILDKLSIYISREKRDQQPIERLEQLAQCRDRSVNYLACQALAAFVEREEKTDDQG